MDLKDHERAVVWVDGRVEAVLKPGLYALWTVFHDVRVEVFDARAVRFEHADLAVDRAGARRGAAARGGRRSRPATPACSSRTAATRPRWPRAPTPSGRASAKARILDVDLREQVVDVAGQEIMTADKVTLRLNAVVTYKVADPLKAVTTVEDYRQALYREAQLALRGVIGTRELDALLSDKDAVARELDGIVRARVAGVRPRGRVARHPRRDPARRDEGPDEQGDGGQEGGRGRPHHAPRGDGGHALAGQHGARSWSRARR